MNKHERYWCLPQLSSTNHVLGKAIKDKHKHSTLCMLRGSFSCGTEVSICHKFHKRIWKRHNSNLNKHRNNDRVSCIFITPEFFKDSGNPNLLLGNCVRFKLPIFWQSQGSIEQITIDIVDVEMTKWIVLEFQYFYYYF